MEVVRSLNYFVRRFETNRKNMRLNIQSGSSLSPNDLVRIQLPSNALIDLSTFELTSDLTVSGDLYAAEYVYHKSDTDTSIRFQDDIVDVRAGGWSMIKSDQDNGKITINNS